MPHELSSEQDGVAATVGAAPVATGEQRRPPPNNLDQAMISPLAHV
jgi:hypothetical protein